jgi:hypothetical protein
MRFAYWRPASFYLLLFICRGLARMQIALWLEPGKFLVQFHDFTHDDECRRDEIGGSGEIGKCL